jgi:hypothetical protein
MTWQDRNQWLANIQELQQHQSGLVHRFGSDEKHSG